jgi:ankyrin repeat protein
MLVGKGPYVNAQVVKFLVKGANVTAANNNGWAPVNAAAGRGHLEIVKFLVEKGADITVADNNGWTPVR